MRIVSGVLRILSAIALTCLLYPKALTLNIPNKARLEFDFRCL